MPGYRKSKLKSQVYRNKAKLKRLAAVIERKAVDQTESLVDVNSVGGIEVLSSLTGGDSFNNRTGMAVVAKTITIRGFLHNNHGTPVDCICRLIVWKDKRPNGVAEVMPDNILRALEVNSLQDWEKKEGLRMLWDQTYVMDTSQHSIIPFKIRISRLNTKVTYQGTGGGEGNNMTNHYYFGFFSTVAGTTNDPLIDYDTRFTYDDA